MKVTVKLSGGIGNQLFQYAAAKSLANKCNADLFFDLSYYNSIPDEETFRKFCLNRFHIDYQISHSSDFSEYLRFGRWKQKLGLMSLSFIKKVFHETQSKYESKFEKLTAPAYLVGHFHSLKYFKGCKNIIINELLFDESVKTPSVIKWEKVINESSYNSSIHFRRTDFVTNKRGVAMGGELPMSYYASAISKMKDKKK